MNNEPVAFMCPTGLEYKQRATDFMYNDALYETKLNWIPLYTHPVDAVNTSQEYVDKTQKNRHDLTDEEINWLAKAYSTMEGELNAPAFARAILRKAQEK